MSRRAELWQQLLQLRNRFAHHLHTILGTWPGLLTGASLILVLAAGILFLSHSSTEVSAKASSPSLLGQLATRTATAAVAKVATTSAIAPLSTPTLPWSPFATATQVAVSPLVLETGITTQVVPLPTGLTGPDIVPVDISPIQTVTGSRALSETQASTPTATIDVTANSAMSFLPTVTPTAAGNGSIFRAPTATPTPTQSILEALQQPVAPGGMAAIVETATAVAPPVDQAATEFPTVTEAEVSEVEATPEPMADGSAPEAPAPTATVFSQPTPDGNVRTAHVPILMYHYLSVPPADADAIRLDLSVTPELFAAHLDAMRQAGYTTISLYTLLDNLTQGTPLPDKPVVISFDDGYRDSYTNALPLLRDRGMTATFFIVPDFIDNQRPEYLTWDMVREMYAAGMSIEGHGRNHVSLANKDHDYLEWQALGSYEAIQRELGVRPHFVAYPAGEYDQATIDMFRSANFWAAVTTEQGATHRSDDLFELKRVRVHGTTSAEQLLNLLALDW